MEPVTLIIRFFFFLLVRTTINMTASSTPSNSCRLQKVPSTDFVCVCDADGCDGIPPPQPLQEGSASVVLTSKSGQVFAYQPNVAFTSTSNSTSGAVINVSPSSQYQKLFGFGGAFTDAATMNIMNLSSANQDALMRSYFSKEGLQYSIGRIPMASCDFSTHEYSYDDTGNDFNLSNFSLAEEDIRFKIPLLQRAVEMSSVPLRLFGSPWSAPAWMKTNGKMHGRGQLKGEAGDKYHKTWAMYFVRFIEAYALHNLTIWGVTVQNEPADGEIPFFPFQCMHFSAEMERDFIKKDLGPVLRENLKRSISMMIMDDQRLFLPKFAQTVLSDPDAAQYVSGIATHWYLDSVAAASDLLNTHQQFPDQFILSTEACEGFSPVSRGPSLGSWSRAESYAHDIIEDLNNRVAGWVDWNLALNMEGGPNWANNFVDSPILVDAENDTFYKQPMYYALGHFSAFVPPGSIVIASSVKEPFLEPHLEAVAFVTMGTRNVTTVVVLNRHEEAQAIAFHDAHRGYAELTAPGRSIQTIRYYT